MTIFWTSDVHIGHENIIAYSGRPFKNVPEMNEKIVEGWNQTVTPEDTVYVVGDFAMGKMADSLPVVGQLQGHKILIPGNHDRLHPMYKHKKGYAIWDAQYREVGKIEVIMDPICRIDIGHHKKVLVSHFPYTGDHTGEEDRYVKERPHDSGEVLVHGHVHDAWTFNGRCVNVGLDAWGGHILPEAQLEHFLDGDLTGFEPRFDWPATYPEVR